MSIEFIEYSESKRVFTCKISYRYEFYSGKSCRFHMVLHGGHKY